MSTLEVPGYGTCVVTGSFTSNNCHVKMKSGAWKSVKSLADIMTCCCDVYWEK